MVESHFDGILAYCDKKVSLGYIESTNLKAKNVIRSAYFHFHINQSCHNNPI